MIAVSGDLTLTTPRGGTIRVRDAEDGILFIEGSDGATLWELVRVGYRTVRGSRRIRRLLRLRNYLDQPVHLTIDGNLLVKWPPLGLPRPGSARAVLEWIKERR